MDLRIGVIGAGISGLTAAATLRQRCADAEIIIWDRRPRIGGCIWSDRINGQIVEGGADALVMTNPRVRAWVHRLGLDRQTRSIQAKTAVPLHWTTTGLSPRPVDRSLTTATSFADGLQALPQALAESLPGAVETGNPVWRLVPRASSRGRGWDVYTSRGTVFVDGLVVATDAWTAGRLLHSLAPEADDLLAVRYRPRVVVAGVYRRDAVPPRLSEHSGVIVESGVYPNLRAVSALTAKWGQRGPEHLVAIRTMWVGSTLPVARESNATLVSIHRDVLAVLGLGEVAVGHRIFRWYRALGDIDATLRTTLQETRATWADEWPSLAVTGSFWNHWGVADCMEDATQSAEALVGRLGIGIEITPRSSTW